MADTLDGRPSILVVDDEPELCRGLLKRLRSRRWNTRVACTFKEALTLAAAHRFDRAVVDLRLPDGNGIDLLEELQRLAPGIEVVIATGYPSLATCVQAIRKGAIGYLPKPVGVDEVLAAFEQQEHSAAASHTLHTLERMEWEYIHRVLECCRWNISAAARKLGIARWTLYRKLHEHPRKD